MISFRGNLVKRYKDGLSFVLSSLRVFVIWKKYTNPLRVGLSFCGANGFYSGGMEMHWIFYIVAALVTALAIYVQMKRVDRATRQMEETEENSPTGNKANKK